MNAEELKLMLDIETLIVAGRVRHFNDGSLTKDGEKMLERIRAVLKKYVGDDGVINDPDYFSR